MTTTPQSVMPDRAPTQPSILPLTAVDLDAVTAKHLVHTLAWQVRPHPQLLVDCGTLHALRTLGISHIVSELLVLRQSGAQIWLRNVGPALHKCLRVLRLDHVLLLAD